VASGRVDGLLEVGDGRASVSPETVCSVAQPIAVDRTPEQLRLRWAHSIREVRAPPSLYLKLGGS